MSINRIAVISINYTTTEKVELSDLPHSDHPVTAVSPEMLPCADIIVCKEQCITPDIWCSFLQSAKEVLAIHYF